MLRTIVRLTPSIALPILSEGASQYDKDLLNRPQNSGPKTGWDRVKLMYTGNEYEEVSLELNTVFQSAMCGAFFGACVGGFVSSRVAYLNFIENNQATIFKSTADAKKKLQDYVLVAFAKGAYKWGWRLSFFTGIYTITATTVSVYRGKTSLVEYLAAGALTGAMYKFNMGLAATLVGAGLGMALSSVAGLAILGILKLSGVSMEDIRRALYKLRESREDQFNQVLEKSATIKNDALTLHHNTLLQEKGEKAIDDIK